MTAQPPMPLVFISHAAKDRSFVERELIPLLRQHRIEIWYATQDISSAAEWESAIRNGLERCDWLLLVLSPDAIASRWVKAEANWALSHREGRVIPLLHRNCTPEQLDLRLRLIQYIDYRQDRHLARARLIALWPAGTPRGVIHDPRINTKKWLLLSLLLAGTVSLAFFGTRFFKGKQPADRASLTVASVLKSFVEQDTAFIAPSFATSLDERLKGLAEIGHPVVLDGVCFESGKAHLLPESFNTLTKVAKIMRMNPEHSFELHGYVDNTGSYEYNRNLSQEMASAVSQCLVSLGVDAHRLRAIGYGHHNPLASNSTEEGRARNRRVEMRRVQ
jgi:outer membrane protein OmpA-like peptidoglycan-associated protein